jgi:ABC-type transport system substrate-binding protein
LLNSLSDKQKHHILFNGIVETTCLFTKLSVLRRRRRYMKNKTLYLLFAAVLTLSLVLAACAPEAAPEAPAAEEPAAVEEPVAEEPAAEEVMAEFEGKMVQAPSCDYGGKIDSIVAVDAYTVEFTMCKPDPAFPAKAAFTPFGIYAEEWLMANASNANQETLLSAPVGTGPFALDNWARGESITYKAYDGYWGDKPAYDTLVIRWATEGAQRLLELQSGTVDQITNLSPDDYATVQDDANLTFLPVANPNVLYLAMTNPPFDNVEVRRAIAMGIDRARIVDNFYAEGSVVPSHFTPCSLPNGCVGDSWYEFDAAAAKQALADAGYPDGFETTIYYRDVFRGYLPEPGLVAVEFQTQLRDNLGIEAEVIVMESGEFIDESTNGRLNGLYLLGWGADYPHVTNFLDYHFAAANPQFGEVHPSIYEALEKASQLGDPAEAKALYVEANNAIKELVPMVPIANGASASAALNTLGNAHFRPFGAPLMAQVDPGKDTFVFMQNAEPISLYCADETDGESLAACQQVVETLLAYAIDSGEVVPELATACTANADSTVWTCTLREGVTFHDGSTFDANDVVVSWAAGIDASNEYHVGNTGVFDYYSYLWDGLMNLED